MVCSFSRAVAQLCFQVGLLIFEACCSDLFDLSEAGQIRGGGGGAGEEIPWQLPVACTPSSKGGIQAANNKELSAIDKDHLEK